MFDCQACGLCCKAKIIQLRTGKQSNKNHCSELNGIVGKQVSCNIYDERPKVCKDFISGSESCIRIRNNNGML